MLKAIRASLAKEEEERLIAENGEQGFINASQTKPKKSDFDFIASRTARNYDADHDDDLKAPSSCRSGF